MQMVDRPRHIFGPVISRRLGRSLGVDLVPLKTCSFSCIYCQLGRTTCPTLDRDEYVPFDEVIEDITTGLANGSSPDFVTLSGSGEPTLHARIGDVIRAIRDLTEKPVAVLTNGSLLFDRQVRRMCALADVVLPTLTATDDATYQRVHRPATGLTCSRHLAGLQAFRDEHDTPVWLELFLLDRINTRPVDRERFAELIEQISPERVQLNTAVRPTAEPFALAVSSGRLSQYARELGPIAEVTADVPPPAEHASARSDSDVLALCQRRPSTLEQIAETFGVHRCEAAKDVSRLLRAKWLEVRWRDDGQYFVGAGVRQRDVTSERAHDHAGVTPAEATRAAQGTEVVARVTREGQGL
jgi:wyosine [tRNA(Phe)-imidazoG37] synthetase (radical SAM superfamily)